MKKRNVFSTIIVIIFWGLFLVNSDQLYAQETEYEKSDQSSQDITEGEDPVTIPLSLEYENIKKCIDKYLPIVDINSIPPLPLPAAVSKDNDANIVIPIPDEAEALSVNEFIKSVEKARSIQVKGNAVSPTAGSSCGFYGSDSRANRTSTTTTPWNRVVKLVLYNNGVVVGSCSGAIIRKNYVLTAGHCVNNADYGNPNNKYWFDNIVAYPGYNGSSAPYGSFSADHFYSFSNWTVDRNFDYDIALIHFPDSIGSVAGTFGYGSYSDDYIMSLSITSAGYPYDRTGMVSESAGNEKVTDYRICSYLDACSGQSGSGAWFYDSSKGYMLTSTFSGHGGICSYASLTRINKTFYDWISETTGTCTCSTGECCNGCTYYSSTKICNYNYGTDYRCSNYGCGADAQKSVAFRYCSGGAASCSGKVEWQDWQTLYACGYNQICETDESTYASCSAVCQNGCQNGACCECSSGECCDGCHFTSGTACDDGLNCTENDTCFSGTCKGETKECDAFSDQCDIGKCDEDHGGCYESPAWNYSTCTDSDPCTEYDTCIDGKCLGSPLDCSYLNTQCRQGYCSKDEMGCSIQFKENGSQCDDGLYDTVNDVCIDGICSGENKTDTSEENDKNNNDLKCGNGVLEIGEDCDDFNLISNDGCDQYCRKENKIGSGCSVSVL